MLASRSRRILLLSILFISTFMIFQAKIAPVHATTTWSSPTQVPLSTLVNTKPSVTADNFTHLWLVYQSSAFGTNPQVHYKIYNFIGWTPEAPLTTDTNSNTAPSIYALTNTTLFVAWVSNRTGHQNIWFKTNSGGVWSKESQLTGATQPDNAPSVTQDSGGRIWVAWYRTSGSTAYLYYRIFTPGSGWAAEVQLSNNTTPDILPSVRGTVDGRVWLAWISLRTGNYQVFVKYFDGSIWSSDTRLTTYTGDDFGPSLVQSRDGTMWVAWSREIKVGPNTFAADLYYKNSTNLGSTWSADTSITTTTTFNDFNPSLVQSTFDKMLYLFWSSDMPTSAGYNLFYSSTGPFVKHDLAVSSISVSPGKLYAGGLKSIGQSPIVSINFTIANLGDPTETSQYTLYANSTIVVTGSFTLQSSMSLNVRASWNTTGQTACCVQIKAVVASVPGEIITSNNVKIWGYVTLLPLGDLDMDGSVDIIDAGILALAFQSTPGTAHWVPAADFNNDGVVDIIDASILAVHFNQSVHCP
jgi:hypothetical protein